MAILKHIASKNPNYGAALEYLDVYKRQGLNIVAAFLTESRGTIVVLLALLLVFILITDKKTRNK